MSPSLAPRCSQVFLTFSSVGLSLSSASMLTATSEFHKCVVNHNLKLVVFFYVHLTLLVVFVFDTRTRLKAKNLMYIKQILFVIERLVQVLGGECFLRINTTGGVNWQDVKTELCSFCFFF